MPVALAKIEDWIIEEAEKAHMRGHVEGRVEGQQDTTLRMLSLKFGDLPPSFVTRVQAITDPTLLDNLLVQAMTAETLNDIKLPIA